MGVTERETSKRNPKKIPPPFRLFGPQWIFTRSTKTHPEHGIVDLKTCDDLDAFENDTRKYGYKYQLAFYHAVLKTVVPDLAPTVHIIAVEKREPFRCGVWMITEETLDDARIVNEAGIERLKESRANDVWPTGYETIRILHQL